MTMRRVAVAAVIGAVCLSAHAQSFQDSYEAFRKSAAGQYSSFRQECNRRYAEFLRGAWERFEGNAPMALPQDKEPVPPRPYVDEDQGQEVVAVPEPVAPVTPAPQPLPVEPVRENPLADEAWHEFDFYGQRCRVRMPDAAKIAVRDAAPKSIAAGWEALSAAAPDNALRDCLEARIRYNLCDWAYLLFLNRLAHSYCRDANGATLLMAYLFCQSGYQMRLGMSGSSLVMLFGSRHRIYNTPYYIVENTQFYPYGASTGALQICNAEFEGETPLSLLIAGELKLGEAMSNVRTIAAKGFKDVETVVQVPQQLIEFYDSYPTSEIGGNPLSRWAMYANTPLAAATRTTLYPALAKAIEGCDELLAVNKLLNWVQTGFVYELDDKVWGHDRAFFAEESLYYPYCDCEDRSILFSRLVRDLLGLDVALIYYPGHLATAVRFNTPVSGDAMMIAGKRFTVCDPTYIGAPVGAQMPGLDYSAAQAIVLQ